MGNTLTEEKHLKQFLSLLSISNDAARCEPPQPDFVIHSKGGVIGIEHTRLLLDNEHNNLMKHYVSTDRIMANAEAMFRAKSEEKLTVCTHFRSSYGLNVDFSMLTGKDVKKLSSFIFNFVSREYPSYGGYVSFQQFDMHRGVQVLPNSINRISIYNKYNCWSASQGGVVPDIRSRELAHSIKEKDLKIDNYADIYDEVWLLLVENQWDLTSYFDFSNEGDISVLSRFSRVFILRAGNDEILECVNLIPKECRWNGSRFSSNSCLF
ncbi:MAG: hypothetical protein EOO85_24735 [Pedobacter sp.]|nr:MAG: hypothetical protein EOO85_24735 [Pedobacter sp.]